MQEMTKAQQKERVRGRIRAATDPEYYSYTPESTRNDYVKSEDEHRVAIYARVSTDDPRQTSSFELQQKYYVDLVARHPNWTLVKIYSDEGKSGTTTAHREGFLEMMNDAYKGDFDLIIVKNISRLARNVVDFLSTIRKLSEKKIGVLFESEAIYSLNSNSHMALSFQATIAEEESRIRSRSMESSLRMRLDHGLPLTPELLGFIKDDDGKLIKNPETYKIPKLMFYMYLYGYSTQQIADTLITLSKKSYLGNIKWTANGVASTLRNERYCGDVRTRKRFKVFAADVDTQKTFKNRGEKPQSYYRKEHEQIISYDDYMAVQHIMNNAKYGGTSHLPELRVIPEGLLKGFVIIHPKWASFTADDYLGAARSVYSEEERETGIITENAGAFDFRGYEVANYGLFDDASIPAASFQKDELKFNTSCVKEMACDNNIELLIDPITKRVAIRPAAKDSKYAIQWTNGDKNSREPRHIACRAFMDMIYKIFGWETEYKYKLYGSIFRDETNSVGIFSDNHSCVYILKEQLVAALNATESKRLLNHSGKRVRALRNAPEGMIGNGYYVEKSMRQMQSLTKEEWQTQIEGKLCAVKDKLSVTPYEQLREFIKAELGELFEEVETE